MDAFPTFPEASAASRNKAVHSLGDEGDFSLISGSDPRANISMLTDWLWYAGARIFLKFLARIFLVDTSLKYLYWENFCASSGNPCWRNMISKKEKKFLETMWLILNVFDDYYVSFHVTFTSFYISLIETTLILVISNTYFSDNDQSLLEILFWFFYRDSHINVWLFWIHGKLYFLEDIW